MYFVYFFTIGLVLTVAGVSEKLRNCVLFLHGGIACCHKKMNDQPPPADDLDECMSKKPPSCEFEICMAQKMGFSSSNGTINKWAFLAHVKKHLESDPDLVDSITDNCVQNDLSKYAVDKFCDVLKLKLCTQIQFLKSCRSWNEEGICKGVGRLAAACTQQFD